MNNVLKLTTAFAIILTISSCAERDLENNPLLTEQSPICLTAAYPSTTRAADAGFEDGDRMGVYVLDYDGEEREDINSRESHARNVLYKFNASDNTWNGTTTLYWTPNTPADIIGYYPMISTVEDANSTPFNVSRRQDIHSDGNNMGGYEASDFLWGSVVKAMPTSDKINLVLGHAMAGVRVALKEGTGFAPGEWVGVTKNVLIQNTTTSATIDLSCGNVEIKPEPSASITPLAVNGDWRAVVVPQSVEAGLSLITVTVDGIPYNLSKATDFNYIQGKLHTFTIEVNKRSDTGKYELKLASESVTAWVDDVEFRDGIMREYVIVDVPNRGGLESAIKSLGMEPTDVVNLKLRGEIDEKDFEYIRGNFDYISALNLKDVTVYSREKKDVIPGSAMCGVSSLSHIIFPDRLVEIEAEAFRYTGLIGSLIIPEGVKELHWACFMDTNFMGELSLPSTLETLNGGVFQWGPKFSGELRLPENLKSIGGGVFLGCNFSGQLTLPDKLEYIGDGAFESNSFTGDLTIPKSVTYIGQGAFRFIPFSGNLTLPDGLTEIAQEAFFDCGFKGELVLPPSVKKIKAHAFSNNKFSNIIFPENIMLIEGYAFEGCSRLSGTLEIPKKLSVVRACSFKDCTLLDEVIIGENVAKIEGAAFAGCYNLTSVIVNNPEPPLMERYDWDQYHAMPFEAVPKDNFTIQVPQEAIEAYRQADYWKEFKRFAAYSNFVCRPAKMCALNSTHQETIILNSDGEWSITSKPDWCAVSKTAGNGKTMLTVTVNEMSKGSGNREGVIEFALKGTQFTTNLTVSQYDYEYAEDACITLQRHSKGDGIDVLFLGDGFDGKSISEGEYLDLVKEQMEYFFGLEPYSSHRDYFNVYACIGLSQECGINTSNVWRNTRFKTLYADHTLMHEDEDEVMDYAVKFSPLTKEKMSRSLIIMALNSDEYGSQSTIFDSGAAIAICCKSSDPYPMDTRGIIQHEACGHAFGKLADERVSYNAYAPISVKQTIREMNSRGWYQNVSINGNLKTVHWSHFVFDPRYSVKVDIFEGGCGFARDVFRCEINSCMNYGIPYFSAISRQDIMKRILEYSGEGFSMEKFYTRDSDEWGNTGTTRSVMVGANQSYSKSGKHRPVRFVKSKKY